MAEGFAPTEDQFPTTGMTDQLHPDNEEIPEDEVDLQKYLEFVDFVTSKPSKEYGEFAERLESLAVSGCNIERLLTAAVGINAEGGEFMEIVKKMIFQGKPWNEDNREHLIIELGDVMWYVAQACMALNISMDEVIHKNVSKLLKRYPEGVFDVVRSEVRKAGDR
jgi:NTP pyrophosphatase (non-canonical NTP hydrolase)